VALVPALAGVALLAFACSSNSNNSSKSVPVGTTQSAAQVASQAPTTAAAAATSASAAGTTAAAATSAAPGKVTKVAYVPNWFAEPENAGELMAKLLNYYPKDLDVDIRNGGPNVNGQQLLQTGQIQFTLCAADNMLINKEQGLETVGLLAGFQSNPQVLISHKEQGVKSFDDMKGKAVAVSQFQTYYPYLQKTYGWSESDKQQYNGSIAPFLANKSLIEQGYYTSEPYLIDKQGQAYDVWLISKTGYDPYASLLCTTKDFAQKNPDVVKEFVQAAQKGWLALLKPENQKILADEIAKRNDQEDTGSVQYALQKMPDLMFNDDTKANGYGHMSDARWQLLMQQMVDTKVLKGPVDLKGLYDNSFLDPNLKTQADLKAGTIGPSDGSSPTGLVLPAVPDAALAGVETPRLSEGRAARKAGGEL
jgi:NitT/TauT family transport system substrate-binding protein